MSVWTQSCSGPFRALNSPSCRICPTFRPEACRGPHFIRKSPLIRPAGFALGVPFRILPGLSLVRKGARKPLIRPAGFARRSVPRPAETLTCIGKSPLIRPAGFARRSVPRPAGVLHLRAGSMKPKSLQISVSKRGPSVESFFGQPSNQLQSHLWSLGLPSVLAKTSQKAFWACKIV